MIKFNPDTPLLLGLTGKRGVGIPWAADYISKNYDFLCFNPERLHDGTKVNWHKNVCLYNIRLESHAKFVRDTGGVLVHVVNGPIYNIKELRKDLFQVPYKPDKGDKLIINSSLPKLKVLISELIGSLRLSRSLLKENCSPSA